MAPLIFVLLVGGLVMFLLAPGISSYWEQRRELDQVRNERTTLRAEIAEIEADIENVTNGEGFRRAARCYGQFVEPGVEVYAVPGLSGCANAP